MAYDYGLGNSTLPGDQSTAQTAAGTTQGDAATMVADFVSVATVGDGSGVILRASTPREIKVVCNAASANTLLVYPPSGGTINGATANLPLSLPAKHSAMFIPLSATAWAAIYG